MPLLASSAGMAQPRTLTVCLDVARRLATTHVILSIKDSMHVYRQMHIKDGACFQTA